MVFMIVLPDFIDLYYYDYFKLFNEQFFSQLSHYNV